MGANALIAGFLCMTLPETKDLSTAETMDPEEGEEPGTTASQCLKGDDEELREMTMQDITNSRAHLVSNDSSL